jgi:hypothetical protein
MPRPNEKSTNPASRRTFLRSAGAVTVTAGAALRGRPAAGGAFAAPEMLRRTYSVSGKLRPDLLDSNSPLGLEVIQLTSEPDVPSSHLYMEAQIFTMDSKRFVLHRSATAHGSRASDPEHRYLLCDIDDGNTLHPLTQETGATAATVSPDGSWLYYFVDQTTVGGGRLTLRRVHLDGTGRETLVVIDAPLPGTRYRPSHIYPLSTISSDGRRLAVSAFLGDGKAEAAPFGLLAFDLERASVRVVLEGPSWCNLHAQYSRAKDPAQSRDILVQENHGNVTTARGETTRLTGGAGADIHVIRDDGSDFRDMPWGRNGNEQCQGHQCWRGRSAWAITSTSRRQPSEDQLIEGRAAPHAGHVGSKTPGGVRNDLSRTFPSPHFYHFATDIAGKRLISDAGPYEKGGGIYLAELGEPGRDPLQNIRYLLCPRSSCTKDAHIHPFLSPDGTMAFFNSDESGILQAYMIRGL